MRAGNARHAPLHEGAARGGARGDAGQQHPHGAVLRPVPDLRGKRRGRASHRSRRAPLYLTLLDTYGSKPYDGHSERSFIATCPGSPYRIVAPTQRTSPVVSLIVWFSALEDNLFFATSTAFVRVSTFESKSMIHCNNQMSC